MLVLAHTPETLLVAAGAGALAMNAMIATPT